MLLQEQGAEGGDWGKGPWLSRDLLALLSSLASCPEVGRPGGEASPKQQMV